MKKTGTVTKLQAVMNANHGPWLSGEILRKNRDGLKLLLQLEGPESRRWQDLLEDIAWDRDVDYTTLQSSGSLDSSAFVAPDTFKSKGQYVEMRRWFS
eukprot:9470441-Pyramimonas_sp.AAC.2